MVIIPRRYFDHTRRKAVCESSLGCSEYKPVSVVSDVDHYVERFGLTLRFFDDASEFSVCSFYVVFNLSYKFMLIFIQFSTGTVGL